MSLDSNGGSRAGGAVLSSVPVGTGASVMASAVRPFLKVARDFGDDLQISLARVGLREDEVFGAEARLSHEQISELFTHSGLPSRHPEVGLLAARNLSPAHLGLLEAAMRTQPTLGEGLKALERLCPLLHDAATFRVEHETATTSLMLPGLDRGLTIHPIAMEFALATLLRGARYMAGPKLTAVEVRFRHAAPPDTSHHRDFFRCPVVFSAPRDALVLRRADLSLPLIWADKLASEALVSSAQSVIAKIGAPDRWEERVAKAACTQLESGQCDATAIAKEFGMTLRTLQRKLLAEGTSVSAIVDRERRRLADNYLRDPHLTFDEVAERLGFASTPGFHRALKRWTGRTSAQHRRALLCGDDEHRRLHDAKAAARTHDWEVGADSTKPTLRAIPRVRLA